MGMHDEVYCDAELPDADVPAGAIFETTAFPEPFLFRYRIANAGRLIDACGRDLECDGYLEFFYYLDRSVENCSLAEYRAHFCRGQLNNIVRVKREQEVADVRVIYGLAAYRIFALAAPSSFMSDTTVESVSPEPQTRSAVHFGGIGHERLEVSADFHHPSADEDLLTQAAAAKPRSDGLGSFLDDWEVKQGELTPEELARAAKELAVTPKKSQA
jgi:hypothetical protein